METSNEGMGELQASRTSVLQVLDITLGQNT